VARAAAARGARVLGLASDFLLLCFGCLPTQWVASRLRWAAGETNVSSPLQARPPAAQLPALDRGERRAGRPEMAWRITRIWRLSHDHVVIVTKTEASGR
jgi:hypothetical protein